MTNGSILFRNPFPRRGGRSPNMLYTGMCHLTGMVRRKIALHKGPHLKFALQKGQKCLTKGSFLLKIEVSPQKIHVLSTSTVKFSTSPLNHTLLGTFCLLFLKLALKRGQNFSPDAPYRRVGFEIPKWHIRVQKSGKSPSPGFHFVTSTSVS